MESAGNITDENETQTIGFYKLDIGHVVACMLISILILITNTFVVYVLRKGKYYFDEATCFLFQTLAIADLLGGASGSLLHAVYFFYRNQLVSVAICECVPPFVTYFSLNSLYLVCVINIQRYLAVSRPMLYVQIATMYRFKVATCITLVLVMALTATVLPIKGFPFTHVVELFCREKLDAIMDDVVSPHPTQIKLLLLSVALTVVLPLCVVSFLNYRLLVIAYRASSAQHGSHISCTSSSSCRRTSHHQGQRSVHIHLGFKGLKTISVITILFNISCLPFILALFLTVFKGEQSYYFYFLAMLMLLCNCWWNAPVYFLTSKTFRKKALEVVGTRRSRQSLSQSLPRERSGVLINYV